MVWFTIVLPSYRNQDRFKRWNFFQSYFFFFFFPEDSMQSLQCILYCHLHTILHNRIAVHILQRYHCMASLFIRRGSHCGEMHRLRIQRTSFVQPCEPFYFYFYLVCRTSHIPRELIISVFNFLSLVYTELCVLNGELLLALPVCLLCNTEFICHRWTVARKNVLINRTQSKRDTIYQFTCCYAKWETPFGLFCIKKNASQPRQSHWIKNIKTLKCRKMCMEKIVLLKYQKIQLDRSENKFYWIIKIIM